MGDLLSHGFGAMLSVCPARSLGEDVRGTERAVVLGI